MGSEMCIRDSPLYEQLPKEALAGSVESIYNSATKLEDITNDLIADFLEALENYKLNQLTGIAALDQAIEDEVERRIYEEAGRLEEPEYEND